MSEYRVQIHLPKNRKSGFQDPSKYPPQTPQNRPRRHLDPQGPLRSSQGLSGTSLGPSQDASGAPSRASQDTPEGPGTLPGPPPNPQVSSQDPSGAPRASQGSPWDPPRCLRTPLQGLPGPLRTPWDLPRTPHRTLPGASPWVASGGTTEGSASPLQHDRQVGGFYDQVMISNHHT